MGNEVRIENSQYSGDSSLRWCEEGGAGGGRYLRSDLLVADSMDPAAGFESMQ